MSTMEILLFFFFLVKELMLFFLLTPYFWLAALLLLALTLLVVKRKSDAISAQQTDTRPIDTKTEESFDILGLGQEDRATERFQQQYELLNHRYEEPGEKEKRKEKVPGRA
ncbi:hypothetical protein [Heliorestis convoluta]|uniref:Uncharacterized protein n=1 Tax=Heliorestis convoluta TaxID=356322 RepID=A0A5Q2N2J2_9FIRM|nr:hypothetical protein [Heliorestis convoluta]QGG49228.1 hypothetical protein FTV88_3154 [Heliorestis convoluta]